MAETSPHKLAYTIGEAMDASGLSRSFLYAAIGRGHLRALKAGRRTLVPAEGLQAFLTSLPALKTAGAAKGGRRG